MKKKILKGFTLIELIIVLAIFSVLMIAAMSLVDPVSRIFSHSQTYEQTYAYVDNIQNYLEDSLKFADNLWVYQGDLDADDLSIATYEMKESFYKDILNTKNGTTTAPALNTIRVMTLLNHDTTFGSVTYPKGQIIIQDVTYKSDATARDSLKNTAPQLNDDFFGGKYAFDYSIGVSKLVKDSVANDGTMAIQNLLPINDITNAVSSLNYSSFGIGIVAYDNTPNRDGSAKNITRSGHTYASTSPTYLNKPAQYRSYEPKAQYQIANIPLLNIIERGGTYNKKYFVQGAPDASGNPTIVSYPGITERDLNYDGVADSSIRSSFYYEDSYSKLSFKCDDNIYIVYALPDEVNVAQ